MGKADIYVSTFVHELPEELRLGGIGIGEKENVPRSPYVINRAIHSLILVSEVTRRKASHLIYNVLVSEQLNTSPSYLLLSLLSLV
jgi:hypothetical protein